MIGPARVLSAARYIIGHMELLNTRMCSAHTPERIELSPIRNGTGPRGNGHDRATVKCRTIARRCAVVYESAHGRSDMAQPLPASPEARDFIGVDEASFRRDFAVFVRYHFDFLRKIPARHPSPPVLTLKKLDEFVSHTGK
jgi:hypothetical protein